MDDGGRQAPRRHIVTCALSAIHSEEKASGGGSDYANLQGTPALPSALVPGNAGTPLDTSTQAGLSVTKGSEADEEGQDRENDTLHVCEQLAAAGEGVAAARGHESHPRTPVPSLLALSSLVGGRSSGGGSFLPECWEDGTWDDVRDTARGKQGLIVPVDARRDKGKSPAVTDGSVLECVAECVSKHAVKQLLPVVGGGGDTAKEELSQLAPLLPGSFSSESYEGAAVLEAAHPQVPVSHNDVAMRASACPLFSQQSACGGGYESWVCAICHNAIPLADMAHVKGCEHPYCANCILQWCSYKEYPWCPQCRLPFDTLGLFKLLDGSMSDAMVEESVCLLMRAPWFQPVEIAVQLEREDEGAVDEDDEFDEEEYYRGTLRIGNRRWGENGVVRAGRMQARVAAPAAPAARSHSASGGSSRAGGYASKGRADNVAQGGSLGRRAKRAQKRQEADKEVSRS